MTRLLLALTILCAAAPALAQTGEVIHFYHTDAIGSVRAVTDAQGNVLRRHDYLPFGEEPGMTPGMDNVRFAGKERDPETQLDYFAARFYLPRTGRFTTSDPDHIGGTIFDPQSWNAYAYARNNPLRFVDPTGTDYFIQVEGGRGFWVDEDRDLWKYEAGGFSFTDGVIRNAVNQPVGWYMHFTKENRLFADAFRRASPGVDVAVGVLSTWAAFAAPVPMTIAACAASWSDCSSSASGLAMALSPKAAKILGGLGPLATKTVAEVIRLRGGGGSQVQKVATHLQNLTLGEVARRAAGGDEAAKTAIKVAKDAKRLHEKY
jgi:RHS repeat-associated protein